ncbi:unnamed protein product [Gongylonema pulchrum]|uniref:4-hydroxy-3-methylbut-2-en-1-yl diphosphate synthase n=1 Tax=Gongylonema pulchrum TaxID=637853 RepID=A0A183EY73_9BILA|nr:unnamed protein product [Gongylonema pulchrum]
MQTDVTAAAARNAARVVEIHRGAVDDEVQRSFDVSAPDLPMDLENVAVSNEPLITPANMVNVIRNELNHFSENELTFDNI